MMHYWGQPFVRSWSFWPYGILSLLSTAVFWILVAFVTLTLIRSFRAKNGYRDEPKEKDSGHALNILKERYAKGEINKKDFDEMKKVIS